MKLMIVDDNLATRRLIRLIVGSIGDDICECSSGEEAIATAQIFKPDCITMDARMGGMSGFEATRKILSVRPTVRIAIVTSYNDPNLRRYSDEAGAVGYVLKENLDEVRALLTRGNTISKAMEIGGHSDEGGK